MSDRNYKDDDRLGRIESKLDKLDSKADKIDHKVTKLDVHVEKNTEDLSEHMKRTDLNEERIHKLEKHEMWVKGAAWVGLGIGGLILAIIRIYKY